MNEPKHLDLFSGIGGFALAAKWAGFKTIGFCDNEPYAQAVLKKHWPDVPVHGDIRTLRGDIYGGVSILTGGFPCQPFSVAGKQRGKEDDRYLWPEMLRVIKEARPTWIVGENVANIVGMALDQVHIDLEAENYEVESILIPACGVDAPHRRNRVWIIARDSRAESLANPTNSKWRSGLLGKSDKTLWASEDDKFAGSGENVANSVSKGLEGFAWNEREGEGREKSNRSIGEKSLPARENVADPEGQQSSSNNYRGEQGEVGESEQGKSGGSDCWRLRESNWAIEPELGRVAHGIPNRVDRLKGLGNAIVPQVAYQILKGIKELL